MKRSTSEYQGSRCGSFRITRVALWCKGILGLVEKHRPLHVSLVGGDPLVRYRELEVLLPELERRGIHVQLVTSAFRQIPARWNALSRLNVVVSVDGLQPEHDVRRKPATYERILKSIAGTKVTIHCTVTGQMMERPGYLEEFVQFWSARDETKRIWISLFTPQQGAAGSEILTPGERRRVTQELLRLRVAFPLLDMPASLIEELHSPPASPEGLHLRPHHAHRVRRPQDAGHSVPVRRHSRLFAVRLRCHHGAGRGRKSPGHARCHSGPAVPVVGAGGKRSETGCAQSASPRNLRTHRD